MVAWRGEDRRQVLSLTSYGLVINEGRYPNFAILWRGIPRGFYLCLSPLRRWSKWWR